jgi:hypothetical protein
VKSQDDEAAAFRWQARGLLDCSRGPFRNRAFIPAARVVAAAARAVSPFYMGSIGAALGYTMQATVAAC